MVHRELPKHQRDLIVERYQSGEGYKRISKALDIPWNTVKTVIIKWRKYGATVILTSNGCPSKIDEKMRRKLVREAAKRTTATLKELQEFLSLPKACGKMCHGLMKPRLKFLVIILKGMFGTKQHSALPKEHYTHSETWWWQHHTSGLFFFSWNWGLSQGWGNYEQFQIPVNTGTKPSRFC